MLVGAPWDGPPNNRRGDIYKCMMGEELNSNCSKVGLGTKMTNKSAYLQYTHYSHNDDYTIDRPKAWSITCKYNM